MRIIDKRGMVFGKINVIDLMVIIFVLSLTPMGYYARKIYTQRQPQPQPKATIEIPIKEYEELKAEIDNLTVQQDSIGKERDILQSKINNFLKEHKKASRYFK